MSDIQTLPLTHEQALDALCGCAATVTVLSYQEAIEGYFALRGLHYSVLDSLAGQITVDDSCEGMG